MSWMTEESALLSALREVWGYTSFRPHQLEVCKAILSQRDVLVTMATGAGKSLLYQLPAVVVGRRKQSVALVISPLVSLMEDQVASLNAVGVHSLIVSSNFEFGSLSRTSSNKGATVLYITPESLRACLPAMSSIATSLTCIAVDEAHCMIEWGFDFRPAYAGLSNIRSAFPGVPIIALTATATPVAATAIIDQLHLRDPLLVRTSFNRSNLYYSVTRNSDPSAVANLLQSVYATNKNISCLVYVLTQADATSLATYLQGVLRVKVASYHAGMTSQRRTDVHRGFCNDEIQIIVATLAFGMGINKPDIRYVVHYGLPSSLEAYYQQTGRAGRDGVASKCILMHCRKDVTRQHNIKNHYSSMTDAEQQRITDMSYYANTNKCRRRLLLDYFEGLNIRRDDSDYKPLESCCDVCDLQLKFAELSTANDEKDSNWVMKGGVQLPAAIDLTSEIRLILRAVLDCGERFGSGMPIHLLLGSTGQQLQKLHGYKQKTTYAQGKHHTQKFWTALFHQLVEAEQLLEGVTMRTQAGFSYQMYRLTDKGRTVLKNGGRSEYKLVPSSELRAVMPLQRAATAKPLPANRASIVSPSHPTKSAHISTSPAVPDSVIEEAVRSARSRLAKFLCVAPYSILSTADIEGLVAARPTTVEQLHGMQGWGYAKIKSFGSAFIDAIRSCLSNSKNTGASISCEIPQKTVRDSRANDFCTSSGDDVMSIVAASERSIKSEKNTGGGSVDITPSLDDDAAWNDVFDRCDLNGSCNPAIPPTEAVAPNRPSDIPIINDVDSSASYLVSCDSAPTADTVLFKERYHGPDTSCTSTPNQQPEIKLQPLMSPDSIVAATPNPLSRCATVNRATGVKRSRPSIPGLGNTSSRTQSFCGPRIKRVMTVPTAINSEELIVNSANSKSCTSPGWVSARKLHITQSDVLRYLKSQSSGCTFLQLVRGVLGCNDVEIISKYGNDVRIALKHLAECCAVYMDGEKYCVV